MYDKTATREITTRVILNRFRRGVFSQPYLHFWMIRYTRLNAYWKTGVLFRPRLIINTPNDTLYTVLARQAILGSQNIHNPISGLKQRHDKTLLLRNSRTQIELFRVSQSLERFPTDQVSKRIQDPKRASKSVQKPYTICLLSFATYVATNSQPVLSYRSRSGYRKPPIWHQYLSHFMQTATQDPWI